MAKEQIQTFKIDKNLQVDFKKLCELNHTTRSHELNLFVNGYVEKYKYKLKEPEND